MTTAERIAESRAQQGLPPFVDDVGAIAQIWALVEADGMLGPVPWPDADHER